MNNPTISKLMNDAYQLTVGTVGKEVWMQNWYGEGPRCVAIVSNTAVWYHSGKPPVPVRWVLIRDPKVQLKPQALLCSDQQHRPAK